MKSASDRLSALPAALPAALPRALIACALLSLAACSGGDRRGEAEAPRSGAPGHVSAGGATSGEVIAQAKVSGASASNGPAGTPGIPQGSGGTTGGPNMGGATGAQAASDRPGQGSSDTRPGTSAAGDAKQDRPQGPADRDATNKEAGNKESAAKEAAKAAADRQQQQLVAAMDRVALRWRERQAGPQSGKREEGADESRSSPAQQPPRSEKHGSAPASEDVKQPQEQSPDASGASLPSDAYKHGQ